MKNSTVIDCFLRSQPAKAGNLRTDGRSLTNYATCLAAWAHNAGDGSTVLVNATRYSVSTSRIQGQLRQALAAFPLVHPVATVSDMDRGATASELRRVLGFRQDD